MVSNVESTVFKLMVYSVFFPGSEQVQSKMLGPGCAYCQTNHAQNTTLYVLARLASGWILFGDFVLPNSEL
jgi:hypothetical protein